MKKEILTNTEITKKKKWRLHFVKNGKYIYLITSKDWLILFGLVLCLINHCRLFSAKTFLYIYIDYIISKHIL